MDNVNHPTHYLNTSIECIDAMVAVFGRMHIAEFCLCNAFKYIWRHKNKNGKEDLRKAEWYMDKYLQLMPTDALSIHKEKYSAITYLLDKVLEEAEDVCD